MIKKCLQTTVSHFWFVNLRNDDLWFLKPFLLSLTTIKDSLYLDQVRANEIRNHRRHIWWKRLQPQWESLEIEYFLSQLSYLGSGSGTDANVSLTIYGENGNSGPRALKKRFRDLFEKGRTDKFALEFPNVGKLTKVSDWFVDDIFITEGSTLHYWIIPCSFEIRARLVSEFWTHTFADSLDIFVRYWKDMDSSLRRISKASEHLFEQLFSRLLFLELK